MNRLILGLERFDCRQFDIASLRRRGATAWPITQLLKDGENLWSAFRNLRDQEALGDKRYSTIWKYFATAFPEIQQIVTQQSSPMSLYAYFTERDISKHLSTYFMSEGMLQFLCILVALFGDPLDQPTVLLFDEPEISLHPWPLKVLAEAMHYAAEQCQRQILIATHSPTLMSAFDTKDCFVVEKKQGKTVIQPVLQDEDTRQLLERYSLGSLYLNEAISPQNPALAGDTP